MGRLILAAVAFAFGVEALLVAVGEVLAGQGEEEPRGSGGPTVEELRQGLQELGEELEEELREKLEADLEALAARRAEEQREQLIELTAQVERLVEDAGASSGDGSEEEPEEEPAAADDEPEGDLEEFEEPETEDEGRTG